MKTWSSKMSVLPQTDPNAIPIIIPTNIFAKINKLILLFKWKCKSPKIAVIIMKNITVGGF